MGRMLTVIAHYLAQPGQADEIAEVLTRHASASREEPGCLEFEVFRSSDQPDRFVLVEQYLDEAAFQAHRETPHFHANIDGRVAGLLAERSWQRYQPARR
jgi:quinol monooxygenase YgiN